VTGGRAENAEVFRTVPFCSEMEDAVISLAV
jgi:hypothetical protein